MAEKKISLKAIKIALLGDTSVGKTAICNALMNLEFTTDMLSTIGSDKLETKFVLKNGNEIKLILWDTAGQERFRSMALQALKIAQGVVLVFDVSNRKTFDNISQWLQQIKDQLQNPSLVLFGNKADLEKEKWKVSTEEAKKYAQTKGLTYFETSAKTRQGINDGFDYIVNETYNRVEGIKNKNLKLGEEVEEKTGCFGKKKSKKNKK